MAVALPPPFPPAIMQCVMQASVEYQVPKLIVLAVIKTESGGNVAAINKNNNKTIDRGLMQINDIWVKKLESKYGIPNADMHLRSNFCYNIRVGAWVLKQALSAPGKHDFWTRVGNYHSATPRHNYRYKHQVYCNLEWITKNTAWWV